MHLFRAEKNQTRILFLKKKVIPSKSEIAMAIHLLKRIAAHLRAKESVVERFLRSFGTPCNNAGSLRLFFGDFMTFILFSINLI